MIAASGELTEARTVTSGAEFSRRDPLWCKNTLKTSRHHRP